uniref:Uncharacterized protein n=1 Tax=Candidatus Kentrum sp. SD TaxID=2126332 RepID=A0A450Y6N6_9GAMM|nr:MAG: hypothetical protein BECKSD772F_GA0070984_10127 [Candidatus Kentron sp. SD]VFK41459.1 MAG: hypothetical protein BECKSD772E_GA0070983_10126 [Candidatus Kentron sp. SD]
MITGLERKKVVQHILNLAGIAESLAKQIDDLAKALDIECEFVPFDEGFPDWSLEY